MYIFIREENHSKIKYETNVDDATALLESSLSMKYQFINQVFDSEFSVVQRKLKYQQHSHHFQLSFNPPKTFFDFFAALTAIFGINKGYLVCHKMNMQNKYAYQIKLESCGLIAADSGRFAKLCHNGLIK